ncbi:lipid-A-disaccharide synthase [Halioxenophilus aromaticivorans]|uniref:Lipid-A-disaccharide synthase n=1 Tax=Halioxenophilus aromaticivorans TaxID=1306992 RepID=A0AAV3TYK7_9ALTE
MAKPLRFGLVVGERSGDILGAGLIQAIKQRHPDAQFEGIGGELMMAQGFDSWFDQERLAVMGLIEPLKRLPELLRIRKQLFQRFTANPPDVFIGVDSPDFNLDLELKLRKHGIKTVHYVSPSVWAWRQGRIKKIARAVDLMLTLLPFEASFYRQHNVPVKFVGHPLADELAPVDDIQAVRQRLALPCDEVPLVALLPGSREAEVRLVGPVMWQAALQALRQQPQLRFVVPAANAARLAQIKQQLAGHPDLPITVVQGQSTQVMAAANAVVMASGTTTLEALLLGKPMVVAYRMAPLSYAILARLVKSKYISLPNLLADKPLVPELIQDAATPEALAEQLLRILQPGEQQVLKQEFSAIRQQLSLNASQEAAKAVLELVN